MPKQAGTSLRPSTTASSATRGHRFRASVTCARASTGTFTTPEEFETKARDVVSEWLPELGGTKFHVRMHRLGFKGKLSSQHEEQFLDHFVLEKLQEAGTPAAVNFDDPDVVIAIETLGQEAGISRWTRQQLREHELLKID